MYKIDIFPEGYTINDVHDIVRWLKENVGEGNSSLMGEPDFNKHKWNAVCFSKDNKRIYSYIDEYNTQRSTTISAITFQIKDKADYLAIKMRWT